MSAPRPAGPRLGEPVELPWWTLPAALPAVLAFVAGLVVPAPMSGRLVDLVASGLMAWVVVRVSLRVRSRNMQSVWISAAYAFWSFCVLIWLVEAFG